MRGQVGMEMAAVARVPALDRARSQGGITLVPCSHQPEPGGRSRGPTPGHRDMAPLAEDIKTLLYSLPQGCRAPPGVGDVQDREKQPRQQQKQQRPNISTRDRTTAEDQAGREPIQLSGIETHPGHS